MDHAATTPAVSDLANGPASHPPLPAIARRLGYGGLVPFVLGALLVWLVNADARPDVLLALTAYGAVIVSFLGALHWGLAMRTPAAAPTAAAAAASTTATAPAAVAPATAAAPAGTVALGWGVVPALSAWLALLMAPAAGLVVLGAMLVACYAVDRQLYPAHGVAHWLLLRFRLSAVAALSCFIAAAGG